MSLTVISASLEREESYRETKRYEKTASHASVKVLETCH